MLIFRGTLTLPSTTRLSGRVRVIGFVALGGQREGFVEPFVLYGKAADGQFGIGVAADVVHQAADNGCVFGFDFLVKLKVVNGFTQHPAPSVIEPARLLLQTAWFDC